jgi:hypothetical protein
MEDHPPHVVWAGGTASRVFGPYFFHATVGDVSYLEMLRSDVNT